MHVDFTLSRALIDSRAPGSEIWVLCVDGWGALIHQAACHLGKTLLASREVCGNVKLLFINKGSVLFDEGCSYGGVQSGAAMAGCIFLPRMGIALTVTLTRVVKVLQLCCGEVYSCWNELRWLGCSCSL